MSLTLSPSQQRCLDAALTGHSIFITGGAGTGKSAMLHHLIIQLKARYPGSPKAVAVLAPTGVAALAVGGQTLHSWAGLKPLSEKEAAKHHCAKKPWLAVRVMVVDEISMVPGWLLDLLDRGGRMHRNPVLPFGGIQMIFCGDFLQLAPVDGKLCFHSAAWKSLAPQRFELSFAFRQGNDLAFAAMLSEIRIGEPSDTTLTALAQHRPREDNDIMPTKLYSTHRDVDTENAQRLEQLPGAPYSFLARDSGLQKILAKANSWSNAPTHLHLKVGAQVVLLKNLALSRGLVNGSRGVVTGFTASCEPVVRFAHETLPMKLETWTKTNEHGVEEASRVQYPLALAWALTIHKSQGMTLDCVHVDLRNDWTAPGMAYVALSRCRSLEGLSILGFTKGKIKANADALAFYQLDRPLESQTKRAKHLEEDAREDE